MENERNGLVILEKIPMDWKMRGREGEQQVHLLGLLSMVSLLVSDEARGSLGRDGWLCDKR